jgi:rubredoxin
LSHLQPAGSSPEPQLFAEESLPHRNCPICTVQGRLFEHVSQEALVDYYRCDKCGHIWTHHKGNVSAPPRDVTVRTETQRAEES